MNKQDQHPEQSRHRQDRYEFWDHPNLIDGFNKKNALSFFLSETHFLEQIEPDSINSVLDVGCSCGRFVELLREKNIHCLYTGLDISENSITQCRNNYPEHEFIVSNFLHWSPNRQYSLVNATGVVQHEKNYLQLIQKMIDVSSRYILFDVKIANVDQPLSDIEECYCEYGEQRIEMICFSFEHLIKTLEQCEHIGTVSVFGYATPPNNTTFGPEAVIHHWVSCGVFIDKAGKFELAEVQVPDFIRK